MEKNIKVHDYNSVSSMIKSACLRFKDFTAIPIKHRIDIFEILDEDYRYRIDGISFKITLFPRFKFNAFNIFEKAPPPICLSIDQSKYDDLLSWFLGKYAEVYKQKENQWTNQSILPGEPIEDFHKRTTENGLRNFKKHLFPEEYLHYRTITYYRKCQLCGLNEVVHKQGNHSINPPQDVIEYYSAEGVHLGNDCPDCPP